MFSRWLVPTLLAACLAIAVNARAEGGAGTLQIEGGTTFSVIEGIGTFTVTVSRTGGQAGAVGVTYSTADGTALAGRDYDSLSGTLAWADGDATPRKVLVPAAIRAAFPGSRTFSLVLSQPTGGATASPVTAKLTISTSIPPTVAISSPPAGLALTSGDPLPLAVSVVDPSNILVKVQFLLNGQVVGETPATGPFTLTVVAPAAGSYELQAVAVDNGGGQTIGRQTLTVLAEDPANPAPVTQVLTDVEGRLFAGGEKITVSASALGADGQPLRQLDFYADGVLVDSFRPGASAARPPLTRGRLPGTRATGGGAVAAGSVYSSKFAMPGVDKLVSIISVAISQAGHAQISAPITVQAVASTGHRAPKVRLAGLPSGTQIAVGATVSVPVSVSNPAGGAAQAADRAPETREAGTSALISRMEYYLNGLKVKDSSAAPYGFDFAPPSAGVYVLSAIATDSSGYSSVSKPVTVEAISSTVVSLSTVHGGRVEEGGTGRVLFTREGDLSAELTIAYSIKGTALNGTDYVSTDGQPLSGTFILPAGASSKKLKAVIVRDGAGEGPEKVVLRLLPSADGAYQLGASRSAKILITDAP